MGLSDGVERRQRRGVDDDDDVDDQGQSVVGADRRLKLPRLVQVIAGFGGGFRRAAGVGLPDGV